jgi:hypothetical protein
VARHRRLEGQSEEGEVRLSLATLIRRMSEAGAPPEAIALAIEEIEALQACVDARRAADRDRKREQRERQKSADVTGQSEDCPETVTDKTSPLTPPLKRPPDPQKITPPISPQLTKECARKAVRLGRDWQPDPIVGKAAEMIAAWQPGELERELAKFKNYWLAKGGKDAAKLNWQRTWINWLISADERKPRNVERTNTLGRHQPSDGLSSTARAGLAVFGH